MSRLRKILYVWGALLVGILACTRGDRYMNPPTPSPFPTMGETVETPQPTFTITSSPTVEDPMFTASPTAPKATPTPDEIRPTPELRDWSESYVVQVGDTLNDIAQQYGVAVLQIQVVNNLQDPNFLAVGQVLTIPPPTPQPAGPNLKIIPDSELVYGPSAVDLDPIMEIIAVDGILANYWEEIDEEILEGPQIVQMVAENYSVNPRLLLAILEYQSHWVRGNGEDLEFNLYPMGWYDITKQGLASQLSWAADQLNYGFYRWRAGWSGPFVFPDGRVVPVGPGVNAGTVALQYLFSQLYSVEEWREIVDVNGFPLTYFTLYGDPFDRSVEPLLPPDLAQPVLELPFEKGEMWSFTGGPHSAFGNWAAWAALDFAPSSHTPGCYSTDEWVVAAADGVVVRSERGQVVQDLGEDGNEQTGWVVFYLHIETRDRVPEGTYLHVGDKIGHPSCEGGYSTGSHLHIARKYNGVWIEADGPIPMDLGGWIPKSAGSPYEGFLIRDGVELTACSCRASYNQLSR
jgi:LasA protease